MEQRNPHPLDIDLLSYVLGEADVALAAELESHFGTCLLCRIQLGRMRRSGLDLGPAAAATLDYPLIAPKVLELLSGRDQPQSVEPGQVWLAGSSKRTLLWVDAVNAEDEMANVFAATLDIEGADHTSLIAPLTNLDREIAIFTSVPGRVAFDKFDLLVDDLPVRPLIDLVISFTERPAPGVAAGAGGPAAEARYREQLRSAQVRVGEPIQGGTDERLELRQMLADELAGLDPLDGGDDGEPADAPAGEPVDAFDQIVEGMRSDLVAGIDTQPRFWRHIGDVDRELVRYARPLHLRPVANVRALDCTVLIVVSATEGGTEFDVNYEGAYQLMVTAGASLLAIAAPFEPYSTEVFRLSSLRSAYELPRATELQGPRAMWEPRPLIDAVNDYFYVDVFPVEDVDVFPVESEQGPLAPSNPDLTPFLRSHAQSAFAELRSTRAQKAKNRALKGLSGADEQALVEALEGCEDLGGLLARIVEITDR